MQTRSKTRLNASACTKRLASPELLTPNKRRPLHGTAAGKVNVLMTIAREPGQSTRFEDFNDGTNVYID